MNAFQVILTLTSFFSYRFKRWFLCLIFISTIQFSYTQSDLIETSGDVLYLLLPVSTFGKTIAEKDGKGTLQFAKGFLFNELSTKLLKSLIDKKRPDRSNNNSFPSGHTSTAFQSASFLQKRYGWKLGLPAYALAGFVGYSRIEADKHYFIDVVAGMILGIGSSYIFTKPYQKERMELTFGEKGGNYQVGFLFKF